MPGAHKSKHSKQAREGRWRYGERRVGTRAPLPVVVIVCDDTRTAPAYFGELKRLVKQDVTLSVVPGACQGASADAVVDQAIGERKELTEERDANDKDTVWVLIDLEGERDRQRQARNAMERASGQGVRVALSAPCYEVWTLLHLEDTGVHFENCRDVLARVKRLWRQEFKQRLGRKAQADYSKIINRRHEAARRAEAHWKHNSQSRTEMFKIIQAIDACSPQGPKPPAE